MALSQEEQRLLDQLEAALAAEDPKLAQKFGSPAVHTRPSAKRLSLCVGGFIIGLAALIGGITLGWGLSVVGFVVMFGSIAALLVTPPTPVAADPKVAKTPAAAGFMDRLGDRWSSRHDQL